MAHRGGVAKSVSRKHLSRRTFRNELFKKFEQISLDKPLVYFLDFRDTLF
jgi:hypothetical protein